MLLLFAAIYGIDFFTKYWVAHRIPMIQPYLGFPFGGIGVIDTSALKFAIVHTTNTGTAWGMLANYQTPLLIFRMLITAGIVWYLCFHKPDRRLMIPLTCIVAGALGNIFDFFFYGHVIDMFYFIIYSYSYPVFNVADAAIFCSVVYLLFTSKKIRFSTRNAN